MSLLAPPNPQHLTLQDVMRLPCWLPLLFVVSRKQEIQSRAENRAAERPSPEPRRNTTSHACPCNLQVAHGAALPPHLPFRNSNVGYFPPHGSCAHVANYANKQTTASLALCLQPGAKTDADPPRVVPSPVCVPSMTSPGAESYVHVSQGTLYGERSKQ